MINVTWNLPPPPGFQGLREDLPLTIYERHLPHWRQDGATYFVTFRLEDSLPQSKLRELERFKEEWKRQHSASSSRKAGFNLSRSCRMGFSPSAKIDKGGFNPSSCNKGSSLFRRSHEELVREVMRRVEAWLDQGMGSCVLGTQDVASIMVETLHRDDGKSHELDCYVVMPNHVHAIVRPLTPRLLPLESVLQHWKGETSVEINRRLRRAGTLWQQESFDRIIRDEEHLWRAIQYIGRNPRHALSSCNQAPLWIRPSWLDRGWKFDR